MAKSSLGTIHGGVRWNTERFATLGAISGTNCIALAPVPITATRLPSSGTLEFHQVEWNAGPANFSMPGMSGNFGVCNAPTAETSTRARTVAPSAVVTRQSDVASSQTASFIRVFTRI